MAHIHLAWELGGGLGHAGRLAALARMLLEAGCEVSLSLRDLAHSQSLLADAPVLKLQAPAWLHRTVGLPTNPASLAEIVLEYGYLEAGGLAGLVQGWRSQFALLKPDVVVGDYAPTALLAARTMGIRTAAVGIGFTLPPAGQALPNLRDWEDIAPRRLAQAEARVLHAANAVLAAHGAAPLAWASELFLGDAPLLTTWPEIDHYGRGEAGSEWLGPVFARSGGVSPVWPQGNGPRVFAYLKTGHGEHAKVLAALARSGCRVLCYLPEVAGGRPPPVLAPGIVYARKPVALPEALAQADWCVCHGGETTVAQALLAGVPLILLPMQLEQFLLSRRLAATGAAINIATPPADWQALLQPLLSATTHRTAATAFASRHNNFNPTPGVRRAILHG